MFFEKGEKGLKGLERFKRLNRLKKFEKNKIGSKKHDFLSRLKWIKIVWKTNYKKGDTFKKGFKKENKFK